MGCAASSAAQVSQTHYVIQRPPPNQYPTTGSTVVNTQTVVVKNIPDAPKRNSVSSSSSSSTNSSVDLNKKRKELKQASAMATKETSSVSKKEVKITVDILRRYNALSVVIYNIERKNVVQRIEEKIRLSIELKQQAVKMNEEYRKLSMKTHKELQDVQNLQQLAQGQNVFKYFQNQVQFDSQMSKEQEEYIQAKTEMEDCYKRLIALQKRQSILEVEISELKVVRVELMKHYKEQDDILDSIFEGAYGSDLEDRLEGDLDRELERKQRIEIAFQRWKNAQVMVQQASNQLHYAYDRWQSTMRISFSSFQNKMLLVQVAAEARSYLVAASQNLTAAHRMLNTVKFPYCDLNEIQTLNKAITYIFIDVQDKGRHSHAGNVYRTTRDRCYVLTQWVNHVITTSVQKDLSESRKRCTDLQAQLRAERGKLMKERIEKETGEKVVIDDEPDSGIETDEDDSADIAATEAEKIPEAQDLDKQIKEAEQETVEGEESESVQADDAKAVPVPLDELAPAPKQDELFGNLEAVMAEYDKQREEYSKEMEANRARQHADFQMKLQARRSRKRRMMAQQQELNELMQKEEQTAAIEIPNEE